MKLATLFMLVAFLSAFGACAARAAPAPAENVRFTPQVLTGWNAWGTIPRH